jgi:hypothetical protein
MQGYFCAYVLNKTPLGNKAGQGTGRQGEDRPGKGFGRGPCQMASQPLHRVPFCHPKGPQQAGPASLSRGAFLAHPRGHMVFAPNEGVLGLQNADDWSY